jgi:hypothetical protein
MTWIHLLLWLQVNCPLGGLLLHPNCLLEGLLLLCHSLMHHLLLHPLPHLTPDSIWLLFLVFLVLSWIDLILPSNDVTSGILPILTHSKGSVR